MIIVINAFGFSEKMMYSSITNDLMLYDSIPFRHFNKILSMLIILLSYSCKYLYFYAFSILSMKYRTYDEEKGDSFKFFKFFYSSFHGTKKKREEPENRKFRIKLILYLVLL